LKHNNTNNEMKINIFSNIGHIVTSSSYIKHHRPPPAAPKNVVAINN